MRQRSRIWVVVGLLLAFVANAAPEDEAGKVKALLEREMGALKLLEKDVERLDFARLRLIESNVKRTLGALSEKGIAHAQTIRSFQQLIITFRFSSAFFNQIETDENRLILKDLLSVNDEIVRKLGFDDSPFTQITSSVFTQIHKLFLQLRDTGTLPAELKTRLSDLIAPLGHVIAIAKGGDRPRTFDAAVPMYRKIAALYPDFNKIGSSHAAFDIVIEIQGLNEFYGEYAQAN